MADQYLRMPCPECGKRIKFAPSAIGTDARCPHCGAAVVLEEPPEPEPEPDEPVIDEPQSSVDLPKKLAAKRRKQARKKAAGGIPWNGIGAVLCAVFVVFTVGKKLFQRGALVVEAVSGDGEMAEGEDEDNFYFEDAVFVYVQHADSAVVAQDAAAILKGLRGGNATVQEIGGRSNARFGDYDWFVYPAHNGYVPLSTGLRTKKGVYLALAKQLSAQYQATAMLYRDVDFTGEYHFAVAQAGEQKMDAEMKLVGANLLDAKETLTFTGKEWAQANGFQEKANREEFEYEFDWTHANAVSKSLGLKLWDQEYDDNIKLLHIGLQ